jgi:hypothetical protein
LVAGPFAAVLDAAVEGTVDLGVEALAFLAGAFVDGAVETAAGALVVAIRSPFTPVEITKIGETATTPTPRSTGVVF